MKLSTLLDGIPIGAPSGFSLSEDPEINTICYDSRKVMPGAVFIAIKGLATDGHRYINDAIQNGAVAVVCQDPVHADVLTVRVADTRAVLAAMACRFYGNPAAQMTMVGITGTNGKTTVTYLLEQILKQAGYRPGVVGTINYRYAGKEFDNPVTTPESLELQKILRQMADQGVTHVVMEVSSHALDLFRVSGCFYDLAVLTNFTQDHLDYHGDMDHYWACKKRLFFDYLKESDDKRPIRAVVNGDDPKGIELARTLGTVVSRISRKKEGDIYPVHVSQDRAGIRGSIRTPESEIPFDAQLVGNFNLENILSAVGASLALGVSPEAVRTGIDSTPCVPGRLERITGNGNRTVFVDYAHTPDALKNAIAALRPLTPGRLITVFGCGGDRDKSKRPVMGKIAVGRSDLAVVTSDNPRSEQPMAIIAQVEEGIREICTMRFTSRCMKGEWQKSGYVVEPDRRSAIEMAIRAAKQNDTVLIAGKGHETYQILAHETIHFDDREVVRNILSDLLRKGA